MIRSLGFWGPVFVSVGEEWPFPSRWLSWELSEVVCTKALGPQRLGAVAVVLAEGRGGGGCGAAARDQGLWGLGLGLTDTRACDGYSYSRSVQQMGSSSGEQDAPQMRYPLSLAPEEGSLRRSQAGRLLNAEPQPYDLPVSSLLWV